MAPPLPSRLLLFPAVALLATAAAAQTPLSGPLSDTTTGPLTPGVYHVTGAINVPVGETLTVQSGAIVKFNNFRLTVDGTLNAGAAFFTSIHDDTVGGDSNGNGAATTPGPGDWQGIHFTATSDASTLNGAEIRYPGSGGWTGLYLSSADISVVNCVVRDSSGLGLNGNHNSFPTVAGTAFNDNGSYAIGNVTMAAVANMTSNTASGNLGDYVRVTSSATGADLTLDASHCMGGALVATSTITVTGGTTLTLGPGFVLKLIGGRLQVDGTLDANGSSSSPVVVTAFADDDHGGDTNGDGPSSGTKGAIDGIAFGATSDASHLDWVISRYGGSGGWAPVYLSSADITLTNCTLDESSNDALQANGSLPTASSCTFSNSAGIAVDTLPINAVPSFSGNVASGNAGGDFLRASAGTIAGSLSILEDNYPGPVLVTGGSITVQSGETLTLEAGAILKFPSGQLTVNGTLLSQGTAGEPVVLTSTQDDDWGGDTLKDGATSGSPGNWQGVLLSATSDASVLDYTTVRFGGSGGWANVYLSASDATLNSCTLSDGAGSPLNLTNNSFPTVSNCTLENNTGIAVIGAVIQAVPKFTGNVATNNTLGDYVQVTGSSLTSNVTLGPDNLLGQALVMTSNLTVPVGTTLTLTPGTVIKFPVGQLVVGGTLLCQGTDDQEVVLTSLSDDEWSGDTNKNGATAGAAGDWSGVSLQAGSDASTFEHTVIRFGGALGWANLYLSSSDASFEHCVVTESATSGMNLTGSSRPYVRYTDFSDNGQYPIDNASTAALLEFSHNTASNNGVSDSIRATSLNTSEEVSIEPHMLIGPLIAATGGNVALGGKLTLHAGVVVKLAASGQLTSSGGALECLGTLNNPVVFTTLTDDSVAGDTNKDGPSSGSAGDWSGILVNSNAQPSVLRHTLVRNAGFGGWYGIEAQSVLLELEHVRADTCATGGIHLQNAASARGLAAWNSSGVGLSLAGTALDVTQVTSANSGTDGIRNEAGFSGTVANAISWGSAGANYVGFTGSTLRYSNGDATLAGSDGNINTDPLFVDPLNGDINLTAGSPSVGAGDPTLGVDPDCTTLDQGAFFLDLTGDAPATYCTAKINSQGCTPYVDFLGFASATDPEPFELTANDVVNNKNGLFFYGTSSHNGNFQGGIKCVLSPVRRTMVQDSGGNVAPDDCSGTYVLDFNARIQSGIDPALVPGLKVYGQFWGRDPKAPFTTQLSDAVSFTICN